MPTGGTEEDLVEPPTPLRDQDPSRATRKSIAERQRVHSGRTDPTRDRTIVNDVRERHSCHTFLAMMRQPRPIASLTKQYDQATGKEQGCSATGVWRLSVLKCEAGKAQRGRVAIGQPWRQGWISPKAFGGRAGEGATAPCPPCPAPARFVVHSRESAWQHAIASASAASAGGARRSSNNMRTRSAITSFVAAP